MVTVRDTSNYIRVLLYSYYTTITGWGHSWLGKWVVASTSVSSTPIDNPALTLTLSSLDPKTHPRVSDLGLRA